jgi:LysR family transcriptional regulator, glycine cleavage system transcriptional activator
MSSNSSTAFWNYLPAFIAVAETQHLRKAAQAIHVSPSALSRTITILEHRIGYSLFERSGRRLRLTARGEQLLRVLHHSVSMLDEALITSPLQAPSTHTVKSSVMG